jgi:putative ABC transport system ATP-binding protein
VENNPIVRLIDVTRTYALGARVSHALSGVSLDVQRGEFVTIVGPSGSGKSTLLNLVAGIDKPTQGEVWVTGRRVDEMDENALARWRGAHVGIVFQFFQLLPTLTVLENVALPLQLRDLWRGVDIGLAQDVLAEVGMGDHAHKLPSELSGGERQRVALARGLIHDPPLILADEPTGNLDSDTGARIVDLLAEQHRRGKTILLVTHETRLAQAATRRIRLLDGKIVEDRAHG